MTDFASDTLPVLVTWPDYDAHDPELVRRLALVPASVRLKPKVGKRTEGELLEAAADCVAAIVSTDPFSARVLRSLPQLGIIARIGVGTDSIDLDAATEFGIVVTAARGCIEEAVADHTLALILACLRRVIQFDAQVRAGGWARTGAAVGSDLHGKVCGVIGYGQIGRAVALRLAGFGVSILVHDPAVTVETEHELVTLPELLRRADVVTLHVPLNGSTRELIGASELAMMKRGAVLVNSSRGGVIDEEALSEALRRGHLLAAGLDVFMDEPPIGSPLLELGDRVVLTPHIAGLTRESIVAMERHATSAVATYLTGGWPEGVVNPEVSSAAQRRRREAMVAGESVGANLEAQR